MSVGTLVSLTEQEFVDQEIARGRKLHLHDGVWWSTVGGVYSRPAFEFRQMRPGEARPARVRSLLGYSHQVPEAHLATRTVGFMILGGHELASFGMATLRSEKRAQVRKGLKECEIRDMADLREEFADVKAVNVSQALRQMGSGRFDRPPGYFEEHEAEWRRSIEMCFGRPGWRWIGAYRAGRLVAYLTLLAVEQHVFVMAVKSHSDFLAFCPNDALYYSALTDIRATGWCRRVVNGGAAHESLNRFKEQFGFRLTAMPYYSPYAGVVRAAKSAHAHADRLRRLVARALEDRRRRRIA